MNAADLAQVLAIAESLSRSAALAANGLPESHQRPNPRRAASPWWLPNPGPGPGRVLILGFAVARLLPPQAELETIAVAPESQRQGLGRQIFHALAAELKAAGARELLLEVRASNRPALAFYRSLGFVQTGLRPGYYADPTEDAVLMGLQLV